MLNVAGRRASLLALLLALASLASNAHAETKELRWGGCGISKLGFMQDLATAYAAETGINIRLEGGGATKGIRQTAAGQLDLGGSCRLPLLDPTTGRINPEELNVKAIPVGWDALVVIANKKNNKVANISRDQLRDVLTGRITNWKELGGDDRPLKLYIRQGKFSGVGATLRQQLFNNRDQAFAQSAIVLASSGKIEKAVEEDVDGIAVSGISSSRHRDLKILPLDGVTASIDTLKSAQYQLIRILFLIAPKNYAERPELKAFVDFAHSAHGQRIIEAAGTLPYHRGVHLTFKAASPDYLQNIAMIEDAGIYTLSGN